jgi:hypothetical protein
MDNLNPLDDIDLAGMTLGDVKNMENPVLRHTILNMLESDTIKEQQHTSHGMHTSHLMSSTGVVKTPTEEKPS